MVFALSIDAAASDNDDSCYGDRADDKNDEDKLLILMCVLAARVMV